MEHPCKIILRITFCTLLPLRRNVYKLLPMYLLISVSLLQAQIQWEPDVRLTNVEGRCYSGYIEPYGDTLYVIFCDNRQPAGTDIYFMKSTDIGITWSVDVAITPLDSNTSWQELFVVHKETLHVVYTDARNIGYWSIYYQRSIDSGENWETEQQLSPQWHSCVLPGITLDNGEDLFVIWKDAEGPYPLTTLRKSTDAGITWLPTSTIDSIGYGAPFEFYYDHNYQILHFVTWDLPGTPSSEVYYRRSTDQGMSWSNYTIISPQDSSNSFWPAMCGDNFGNIYVVWCDYRYSPYAWTGDIFLSKSTNNGVTWLPYQQITYAHRAVDSDICVVGDTVFIVWEDDRNGFDDNFEIYFRMSTDKGETWLSEERLTFAQDHSQNPQIAVSKKWLYLIWEDHRDGPYPAFSELYFKRGERIMGVTEDSQMSTEVYHIPQLEFYPNPSHGRLIIRFNIPNTNYLAPDLRFTIYDVTGRLVKQLDHKACISSSGQIFWDSRDQQGKEVISGIYFIKAECGEWNYVDKIVLIR